MKEALVTGANGFIGSHLVDMLIQRGVRVRGLVRKTSDCHWIANTGIVLYRGDYSDRSFLKDALSGVDTVFHLAGTTKATHKKAYWKGNVEPTRQLIETLIEARIPISRFLFLSSQAAVGPSVKGQPVSEEAPPNPLTTYGRSKLEAERLVLAASEHLPVTVIRPPGVFGLRDHDFLQAFQWSNRGVSAILGWRKRHISLIFVQDLVEGLILSATHPKAVGRIYHLVTEPDRTWQDVTRTMAKVLGRKTVTIHVPISLFVLVSLGSHLVGQITRKPNILNCDKIREFLHPFWLLDGSRAEKELGFKRRFEFEEAVALTAEWYVKQGWL